jgi:UDP-glucose 4-epimerase
MTRALVTGAAGFIGSHVAQHARDLGFDVIGVDDLSGGFVRNVPEGVTLVQGTITDPTFIGRLWQTAGPFDYVYHLAAYAAEGLSPFIRRFNYTNNVVGSINLINQSIQHNVRCFVFTSSIAVYGRNQLPMREDLTPAPEDPYGIAKYAVELDLRAAQRHFGTNYVIVRPHNVYGERQNIADAYRNVVGIFINQMMQGKPMTIFGDGSQRRAFSYIDEVAPAIARAPTVPGATNRVINIGGDHVYSVQELANCVARAFGSKPEIRYLPQRPEVQDAYADHRLAGEIFGPPECAIELEEGITRMVRWAESIGPMTPTAFGAIEVTTGLPQSWRALMNADESLCRDAAAVNR